MGMPTASWSAYASIDLPLWMEEQGGERRVHLGPQLSLARHLKPFQQHRPSWG
jgi:hypothetical protein